MPRYDLDYDFDYDYDYQQPTRRGYRSRNRFGPESRQWTGAGGGWSGYGREYSSYPPVYRGHGLGYATEYRQAGYGRDFGKSRWETDYGDPFRDRERGTPIRMMRGEWNAYGEEYYGGPRRLERYRRPREGWGREYRFRPRHERY